MSAAPDILAGRVALVTGGAAGLGAVIATTFAAAGARGAVVDLVEPPTGVVPSSWATVTGDVRDPRSVERAFADVAAGVGAPDVVVANAGIV
ncbi:MAG: SDR family NAD(P)-dependent oxidoreductase, partial [Acidimicrobiales bacterium]